MVFMVQGLGTWQEAPKAMSPRAGQSRVPTRTTLSVTVAIIRAFGTRRAVLVFFIKVTEKAGIEI